MTSSPSLAFSRFCVALVVVGAMAAVRYALHPWLGERATLLPFTLAILICCAWAGWVAGAMATLLSLICGMLFSGRRNLLPGDTVELATFLLTSGGILLLTINRSRDRLVLSDARADQRAQEARELAEELSLLIDGAHGHAISMLDPLGNVTIWNKGAQRLKGWGENEVIGRSTALFYPPEAVAAGKPTRDLAIAASQGRLEEEDWRVRKDGSAFVASVVITALRNPDGSLRGFAKMVTDITERRAAQATLQSRESHLRSILATVPDAMVVIDDRGAIISFSATAECLFGYSEAELIGSNVAVLMPEPDSSGHDQCIRRYLETGDRRVIGLGRLVTARRRDGSTFPVELSVGETTEGVQRLFTGFMRDLTEQRCTERQLEALQPGLVRIIVANTGPGVKPAIAQQLFSAFTSTKPGGMGLALSICRTIVEAHGGHIWMQPAPGGGAQFHFTLIRAEMEGDDG